MERGMGSGSNGPSGTIDKSRVLEITPLRTLVPVFPSPAGMSSVSTPQPSPFTCVPPTGPFPAGVQPFYPFMAPNGTQQTARGNFGSTSTIPAPVPLNSYRTPTVKENGSFSRAKRGPYKKTRAKKPITLDDDDDDDDDDDYSGSQNQSEFSMHVADVEIGSSNSRKRRGRPSTKGDENGMEIKYDIEALLNSILTSFKLNELDEFRRTSGDKETFATIVLVYDVLRRRLTQLEEANKVSTGIARRPDLKAGTLLLKKGIRTNTSKRIGHVPGVEVGDIFFFRMELCVGGLHAPTMAGIDYMSVKVTMDEEPVAVSIVSSGGYDDDDGGQGCDVLIYSGQGGVQRRDGQMFDQKLERGNLALEKSVHRANEVRVIRGLKDPASTGKIYVYDGLYRIQESWAEKNQSECNVFKYKLVRIPGQPQAFSLWKSIQQWKDGTASREGLILPDLTSGSESLPVSLVNDVDNEKGPAHFTYVSTLKSKPFPSSNPSLGCQCTGGCKPDEKSCPCNQSNNGLLPYSVIGVLYSNVSLIHECGSTCVCPPNCRNRISQAGLRLRLEVFKTKDKGWGLRSLDPIRGGGFICEYAGDIIKDDVLKEIDDDDYIFDSTRLYEPLEAVPNDSNKLPYPIVISAKNNGNVARFMNHSCSPNVLWKPVLRESNNETHLHIAFFAIRHIPPMQELTFNYGIVTSEKGDQGKKKCSCGSVKCKGFFY